MTSTIQGLNGALPDQQVDLVSASKTSGTQALTDTTPVAPPPAPEAASGAVTNLSALSAALANAVSAACAQSPIRPPIISAIKAQIAAGLYGPDLSDVAAAVARALAGG
jgi:hypothetical protein